MFPQVGSWYRRLDGRLFEVVAVDEKARTVGIQHFDGTIGELEFDVWHQTELESAVAPEDWTGAIDMDQADFAELAEAGGPVWQDPLEFVDRLD